MNNEEKFFFLLEKFKSDPESVLSDAVALARDGFDHANFIVGMVYELGGKGVARDYELASHYYGLAIEKSSSIQASLRLARLHYLKLIKDSSDYFAFSLYKRVYDSSKNPSSAMMLGVMLYEKRIAGGYVEAKKYLEEAARLGQLFAWTYLGYLARREGKVLHSMGFFAYAFIKSFFYDRSDPKGQFP